MAIEASPVFVNGNYVAASQPGCHIAHHDADWIIGASEFDPEDFGLSPEEEELVPDMIIDPDTRSLSVVNKAYDVDKSFFITTTHRALDGRRRRMTTGLTRDNEGKEESAVTLVLVVKSRGVIEACYLEISEGQACGEESLDLFSDVKSVKPHPDPSAWESSRAYTFPLGGNSPRLCSQGVGGNFTHFYSGTLHAIDFECPEGTPVLAVAGGTVKEVRQSNTAGGVHARGLFEWNSVSILQDDGLLAEYVHILADSSLVAPGDRVATGQPICVSGGAGFCPTPHLHFQLQEGEGDNVPTVLFALLDCDGNSYFPVAGRWYGPQGQVEAPLIRQPGEATGVVKGIVVESREGERVDGSTPDEVEGCGDG
ncbi:unnamed protein product, partial [Laminaria digitata]